MIRRISPNDKLAIAVILVLNAALTANFYAAQAQQPTATNATALTNMTTATNATATNATAQGGVAADGGSIITNMTWYTDLSVAEGASIDLSEPSRMGYEARPLSPANIEYQRTDPVFAKLAQTAYDCLQHYNSILAKPGSSGATLTAEEINRQDLCTDIINQGVEQICNTGDFATTDFTKCEEARTMTDTYVRVAETLYG